jgi:hypothetical protein
VPESPPPVESPKSEADVRREKGAKALDEALERLAEVKRAAEETLLSYEKACQDTVVDTYGTQFTADQLPECVSLRERASRQLREIVSGREQADEAARMSWLDAGTRRAAQARHGLEDDAIEQLSKAIGAMQKK